MLQKRIDTGSIPYGLAIAGEDMKKGSAVVTKIVSGVLKALRPTTEAEANAVKGFVTYRVEDVSGACTTHDTIKSGQRCVIYTLVKNNMWGTTEFAGTPAAGNELVVGYDTEDKGKLRAKTTEEIAASRASQFKVYAAQDAGAGYTEAMIDVEVL